MSPRHPPIPGPFVRPDTSAIEEALRDVPFPISKREMIDHIPEDASVVLQGRNVDLRTLVKDLNDDYFESEDEFRNVLENTIGHLVDDAETLRLPLPPTGFPSPMPLGAPGATDQPRVPDDNA